MDKRLLNLSYSGLLLLHSCPRRFQLSRLNADVEQSEDYEASITFAYGHVVGHGVQLLFEGNSLKQVIWLLFQEWKPDLLAANEKQKKSFWLAIAALQNLASLRSQGFLDDWELVYYQDKPACELSFVVDIPGGFRYRGFVDAVLQHKISGEVKVLEVKTASALSLNPTTYKNSAQAIGYSIVLDKLFPEISSYEVLYLVYKTKEMAWEQLEFSKSYLQRALWLQELLLDVEVIKLYESTGVYPMRGESCLSYFRDCYYLQTCTLATDYLTAPLSELEQQTLEEKESQYQIQVNILDLIKSQLDKD